jgi:hypothetical protein
MNARYADRLRDIGDAPPEHVPQEQELAVPDGKRPEPADEFFSLLQLRDDPGVKGVTRREPRADHDHGTRAGAKLVAIAGQCAHQRSSLLRSTVRHRGEGSPDWLCVTLEGADPPPRVNERSLTLASPDLHIRYFARMTRPS